MITTCKKCGSKNLFLEPRIKGQDVMTADMVALKCKDCGAWLKWCPKNERKYYYHNTLKKDKWKILKEFVVNRIYYAGYDIQEHGSRVLTDIIDKMQELEGEMSKCECCKEENSDLITYKGYKMCPACYMGYVRKVKVCENNAKYETAIDQLKQQLEESFTEEDVEGLIEDRDKTIKFLQKELAEKDKEIERYKQELEQTNAGYDFIYEQSGETINELKQLAIQELEKVKDWLNEPFDEDGCFKIGGDLIDFIDQQINALKGRTNK